MKFAAIACFVLSAALSQAQLLSYVSGTGEINSQTHSGLWVWTERYYRGGHSWYWNDTSLQNLNSSVAIPFNGTTGLIKVLGSKFAGAYGMEAAGTTAYVATASSAVFNLHVSDDRYFGPALGPLNNASTGSFVRYAFEFTTLTPLNIAISLAGNSGATYNFTGGSDGPIYLRTVGSTNFYTVDVGTYDITLSFGSSQAADRRLRTSSSYGPAAMGLFFKFAATPGGGD